MVLTTVKGSADASIIIFRGTETEVADALAAEGISGHQVVGFYNDGTTASALVMKRGA